MPPFKAIYSIRVRDSIELMVASNADILHLINRLILKKHQPIHYTKQIIKKNNYLHCLLVTISQSTTIAAIQS